MGSGESAVTADSKGA